MPTVPLLYDSTIYTGVTNKEYKKIVYSEFFHLPLKICNEIVVCVAASQSAQIILHDDMPNRNIANSVIVTLGGNHNRESTIGIYREEAPKAVLRRDRILSATQSTAFVIQWNRGCISVFREGEERSGKPLLSWQSPDVVEITTIGIRTLGCAGEWKVQGGRPMNTPDSQIFQHFPVLSGFFDFEFKGGHDAYLIFTNAPNNADSRMGLIFGACSNDYIYCHRDEVEVCNLYLPEVNSDDEYRRWWVKWDSGTFKFGKHGTNVASMKYKYPKLALNQLNYVGMSMGFEHEGFWRIFDSYPLEEYNAFAAANANSTSRIAICQPISSQLDSGDCDVEIYPMNQPPDSPIPLPQSPPESNRKVVHVKVHDGKVIETTTTTTTTTTVQKRVEPALWNFS